MTQTKKIVLPESAAEALVDMWSEKGQISEETKGPLLIFMKNHEFEATKIKRWANEAQSWRTRTTT